MNESKAPKKVPAAKAEIKDYTLDLPMFDLGEAVKLVSEIHEKALETATMPVVAKSFGYAGPGSTPFYRRVVAARLFRLLGEGAALTSQALDYLKPVTEDAKNEALKSAILGIPAYDELIQTHLGKRLNPEIIANGFVRKFAISQLGAAICAKAFVNSLKFAGFLEADGSLKRLFSKPKDARGENQVGDGELGEGTDSNVNSEKAGKGGHDRTYTLVLDASRSVVVKAPLSIRQSELKRLQDWLALQLLVVPDQGTEGSSSE